MRRSVFFLSPDAARFFADWLHAMYQRDVVVVLRKNVEDMAQMATALARVEGADVHWTEVTL